MAEVSYSSFDRTFTPIMSQFSSNVNPNATLTPTLQKLTRKKVDITNNGNQPGLVAPPMKGEFKIVSAASKVNATSLAAAVAPPHSSLKKKQQPNPAKFGLILPSSKQEGTSNPSEETTNTTTSKFITWKSASADSIEEVENGMQGLGLSPKKKTHNIEQELSQQNLYKTELCRSFEELGTCRYGPKCQFAHGRPELRPVLRHPKYKTEICKTWQTIGTCPYGTRCRFIHAKPGSEEFNNIVAMSLHLMALHKQQAEARLSNGSGGDSPSTDSPVASVVPTSALDNISPSGTDDESNQQSSADAISSGENSLENSFENIIPMAGNNRRSKLSIFAELVNEKKQNKQTTKEKKKKNKRIWYLL